MGNRVTLGDVAQEMGRLISRHLGVKVEVTARASRHWTISGKPRHAEKAARYLVSTGQMVEQSRQSDEDEVFIYMSEVGTAS